MTERSLRDRAATESSSNRDRFDKSILILFLDTRDGIYQTLDIGIGHIRSYKYSNVFVLVLLDFNVSSSSPFIEIPDSTF